MTRNMRLLIGGSVLLVVLVTAWLLWRASHGPPTVSSSAAEVARWVSRSEFEALPIQDKRMYMNMLCAHSGELEAAWREGKVTDAQHDRARLYIYLQKRLQNLETYDSRKTQADKDAFLDSLIAQSPSTAPATQKTLDYAGFFHQQFLTWPDDLKGQWEEFRTALAKRRSSPRN